MKAPKKNDIFSLKNHSTGEVTFEHCSNTRVTADSDYEFEIISNKHYAIGVQYSLVGSDSDELLTSVDRILSTNFDPNLKCVVFSVPVIHS